MITASKSGRKIGSYYIWRLNGLFNKTLTACIISHSSLLKFIKILEVLFRVMPACTLLNPRTFLTLKVETMRIALLVAILNEAVVIQKFYSKLPLFMFLWQIVFFFQASLCHVSTVSLTKITQFPLSEFLLLLGAMPAASVLLFCSYDSMKHPNLHSRRVLRDLAASEATSLWQM